MRVTNNHSSERFGEKVLEREAGPVRRRSIVLWIGSTITVALVLPVLSFLWLERQMWAEDFSKWPPTSVYQMVLGRPPLAGVSYIQASGRHFFIKRWVWLRIQATTPALQSLAKLGEPLTLADTYRRLQIQWSANDGYDEIDHKKIGWDDLQRVAHPVAYEYFTGNNNPWLWRCLLLFDYPNHTVYVAAEGG